MDNTYLFLLILLGTIIIGLTLTFFFIPREAGPLSIRGINKFRFKEFYDNKGQLNFCIQYKYHFFWRNYCSSFIGVPEKYPNLEAAKNAIKSIQNECEIAMNAKRKNKKPKYFYS